MARFAGTTLTDYFSTPDFTQVGKTGMMGQSLQRNAATKAEGLVHGAGIDSIEMAASAGFKTDEIRAGGSAQAAGIVGSGLQQAVGGITQGFGSMLSSSSGGGGSYSTNYDLNLDRPWGAVSSYSYGS